MLTSLQYQLLRRLAPGEPRQCSGEAYKNRSKLRVLLGDDWLEQLRGKVVLDFGCGEGHETLELARLGAARVVGLDIRPHVLAAGRAAAEKAGLAHCCEFTLQPPAHVDAIVSLDAFEHFRQPEEILTLMHDMLPPGGFVLAAFGPTWYHPYGGHLFSVFPWAHLVFSEAALIRWRSQLRSDGATRFSEVEGGLNQMTVARFERLARQSPLQLAGLEPVPIRGFALLSNRWTREFTTAIVRARLDRPPA